MSTQRTDEQQAQKFCPNHGKPLPCDTCEGLRNVAEKKTNPKPCKVGHCDGMCYCTEDKVVPTTNDESVVEEVERDKIFDCFDACDECTVCKYQNFREWAEGGTVCDVKYDSDGFGRHLRIITDGRNARLWVYGHCNAITVEVGDRVEEGDLIATMGNTGFVVSDGYASTFWGMVPRGTKGTHLHLGVREVTRTARGWSYPESDIKIDVKNYDNGYKGSIDPMPFIKDLKSDPITKEETKKTLMVGLIGLLQKLIKKQ